MTQLLVYEKAVPLQVERHREKSVKPINKFHFSAGLNSVPVVAAEIAACVRDMVVVFAGTDDAVLPAVLLGIGESHNLYIDDTGNWLGRYVPAFLRRYPFVFSQNEGGDQLSLCIDENYVGLNDDGVGERLFDSEGERSTYLKQMLEFSAQYQAQFARTQLFCKRLQELDLLEPAVVNYLEGDNQRSLSGFFRIGRERLKKIPQETLVEMFTVDELELCYLHMHSLSNVETLSRLRADLPSHALDGKTVQ